MTAHRRWTLGLFASGALALLLGTWLLQTTAPSREPGWRPLARKVLRVGKPQRRGEAVPTPRLVAWNHHGPHVFTAG